MSTENVEPKQVSEESKGTETGMDLVRRGLSESKTSKETETASVKETEKEEIKEKVEGEVTKEDTPPFKTKAELEKHIQDLATRLAQGMKDKELKPVYDELQKHKKEKEALELKLSEKQEDSALARLEAKEKEVYGDEVELPDFQKARLEAIKLGRANRDKAKEIEATASRLQEVERQQDAFAKSMKFFLPEDKEFLSSIDTFAKKLASAETEKERDLIIELEEAKRQVEATPKEKRTKPDSSLPSAPGGTDLKNLHGGEAVRYALAHPPKNKH